MKIKIKKSVLIERVKKSLKENENSDSRFPSQYKYFLIKEKRKNPDYSDRLIYLFKVVPTAKKEWRKKIQELKRNGDEVTQLSSSDANVFINHNFYDYTIEPRM